MELQTNKPKIMVVDDSKTIRRTAETLLQREGYEVITAEDGFEALSKIANQKPDIIFVDIMMPRLDGYQTCALIKNNADFKATPVIMLSSKDGLFDKAKGRIVGSDQYVTKPFSKDEILEAIQTHSAEKESTESELPENPESKADLLDPSLDQDMDQDVQPDHQESTHKENLDVLLEPTPDTTFADLDLDLDDDINLNDASA